MLALWLPLINNLNNQGLDNAVITNSGATINTSGKIGSCYSFNGSNSFISIDDSNLYNIIQGGDKPFTITFWIYHADSTRGIIFGDWGLSGNINFNIELTASHQIRFYWNGGPDKIFTDTTAEINTWVHIVLTYDGSKICIYKNGSLQTDTYASSLIKLTKTSGLFYLGRDSRTGATALNGRINDFRIYSHCLSPIECKKISSALVLHYPLSREGFGADNIIPNTWPEERTFEYPTSSFKDYFSPITTIVPTASQYTLSFWAKSTVNGDKIRTHFYSPNTTTTCVSSQGITKTANDGNMYFTLSTEWEHYWVTYSQNETTAVKHVICPRMGAVGNTSNVSSGTGTVSIKCIKLEEGDTPTPWTPNSTDNLYSAMRLDSNVAYDVSGYGNNGTKSGTFTYSSDTPRYFTSTVFENNYIVAGRIPIKDELTYSWWAYSDNWGSSLGGSMVSSIESGGMGHQKPLNFACGTGTTSNNYGQIYSMPTPSAGWHMFTETWDGYSFKVYLDGELKNTNTRYTEKTPVFYNANYNVLFIGGESATSQTVAADRFIGKLSDVRVYATALSAEDIQLLYNATISLSNSGTLLTQGELSEV